MKILKKLMILIRKNHSGGADPADTTGRRPFRFGLQTKLLTGFLLTFLIMLSLIINDYRKEYRKHVETYFESQRQTAQALAAMVDEVFDQAIGIGEAMADNPLLRSTDPAVLDAHLKTLADRFPQYRILSAVNVKADTFGTSGPFPPGVPRTGAADGIPWMEEALRTGEPVVSPVFRGRGSIEGVPVIVVAVPFFEQGEAAIGTINVTLRLEALAEKLSRISGPPDQIILVTDREGSFAIHTAKPDLSWEERRSGNMEPVREALEGRETSGRRYVSPLFGDTRVGAFQRSPGHGWVTGVTVPETRVRENARSALLVQLLLLGTGSLLCIVILFLLSRGLLIPLSDLTEERRLTDALRKREEQLRLATAAAQAGAYSRNFITGVDSWSPEYLKIYGISPGEPFPIRDGIPAAVHPDDRERVLSEAQARLQQGKNPEFQSEHRIVRPDGEIRWVMIRGLMEFDHSGNPIGSYGIAIDITESKEALKALEESRERLERAQRIAHLWSWELDIQRGTLVWSDETYRIFGLEPGAFAATYEAFLEAVHPEDREAVNDAYTDSIHENRSGYEIEHRVVRKQGGEIRVVHERCEHFRDGSGRIIRSIGMVHDITEQKKAEEELLERERYLRFLTGSLEDERSRLKTVLESLPVGVWISDSEGRFLEKNPAADRIWAGDAPLVQNVKEYPQYSARYPDSVKPLLPEEYPMVRVLKTGETVGPVEVLIRRFDGSEGTVIVSASPIRNHLGEIAGVIGINLDITQMKQAEAALRESDRRFRALVTATSEVLFRMSPDWSEMNQLHSRGFLSNTDQPNPDWFGQYIPESDQLYVKAAIYEAIRRKGLFELEHRVNRADGGTGWTYSRAVPLLDEKGEIVEWFGTAADITDRKELEQGLRQAKDAAERANRAKSEFLAHMSHEIRTPISGIIGMTDLLSTRLHDGEQKEYLEMVRESAHTLLSVIGGILDLSRIESGMEAIRPVDWEIRKSVEAVIAPFRMSAEGKALPLSVEIGESVPELLHADKDKITQILSNLVSNAIKYTDRGGIHVSITGMAQPENRVRLWIRVTDTGIGIPEGSKDMIFESFVRLRKSVTERNVEGTGLGLTITKRLVELLGGVITVESTPGIGSEFTVILEVEKTSAADRKHLPVDASRLSAIPRLSILVVEDNRINQLFLEVSLTEAGHAVRVAAHGGEALELIQENGGAAFDLILMDIQMPVMDGIEATRHIRAMDGQVSGTPIIALTAFAMKDDEERFRQAGMNGYVTKPVDWDELTRVIQDVLT